MGSDELIEIRKRPYAEAEVQIGNERFREPWKGRPVLDLSWKRRLQLFVGSDGPRLEELVDFFGQIRSDPINLLKPLASSHQCHIFLDGKQRIRSSSIGPHSKRIGTLRGKEISH